MFWTALLSHRKRSYLRRSMARRNEFFSSWKTTKSVIIGSKIKSSEEISLVTRWKEQASTIYIVENTDAVAVENFKVEARNSITELLIPRPAVTLFLFLSSRFIVIPNLELCSIKNPKIYWNSLTSFEISCSRALDLLELDTVNFHVGFKAISIASGNVTMNVNIPFSSFTSTLITVYFFIIFFIFLRQKFFHNYVDVTISTHFIYCFCFYNLTCVLTIF